MPKAGKLYSKKIYYRAVQYVPCPPGVKLINVLFAGAKLLRTGYQNKVPTSGLGAVRTSLAPGTTSSPAAPPSSRAKCEGKHLNIHVIWESCILDSTKSNLYNYFTLLLSHSKCKYHAGLFGLSSKVKILTFTVHF